MYIDDGRIWGAMTTNVFDSYKDLLKKPQGLPMTAIVHMTFKALVDRLVEQSNLANALLQNDKPWTLSIVKKFLDYWREKSHSDMMIYQTDNGVFEILTFAHDGRVEMSTQLMLREKYGLVESERNITSHAYLY